MVEIKLVNLQNIYEFIYILFISLSIYIFIPISPYPDPISPMGLF